MSNNLENVYDKEIFPLMSEIIEVCKKNDIYMIASFQLDHTDTPLYCTTVLVPEEAGEVLQRALIAMRPEYWTFKE